VVAVVQRRWRPAAQSPWTPPAIVLGLVSLVLGALLCAGALAAPAGAAGAAQPQLGSVPFPNDLYTVADRSTPTGRRVHFVQAAMPANAKGVRIDPHAWNWSDGFSPGGMLVVRIPGLDNQTALQRSKLVPLTDMARAFDRSQGVVVIDAGTGARWPIWAELDTQAARDADRNLLIRPARNFLEGHRYIVALRHLVDRRGRPIPAPPGAAAGPHQAALRAALARAGIGPGTIRLSIGLEDADDLIDDLKRALRAAEKAAG
jgi:hypothetical protein